VAVGVGVRGGVPVEIGVAELIVFAVVVDDGCVLISKVSLSLLLFLLLLLLVFF